MANFLENYETANATIKRFWLEFPNGRIIPDHVKDQTDLAKGYITVRTEIYRDQNDVTCRSRLCLRKRGLLPGEYEKMVRRRYRYKLNR
jgi:hypothetical protein